MARGAYEPDAVVEREPPLSSNCVAIRKTPCVFHRVFGTTLPGNRALNLPQNEVHSPTGRATGPTAKGGGNSFSAPMPDEHAVELAVKILARPGGQRLNTALEANWSPVHVALQNDDVGRAP